MSSDDPDWEKYGYDQSLYGVVYQRIADVSSSDRSTTKSFAYCKHASFRRIPIENEIVTLVEEFNVEIADAEGISNATKTYWEDIVSIWNSPHLNAYPDSFSSETVSSSFQEEGTTKPLRLCPGDVSLEGRHGQSIRFGGTSSDIDVNCIEGEKGSPYTIIRNGQAAELDSRHSFSKGDGPVYSVLEDINSDSTSIYLTSNHSVPLEESFTKRKAWKDSVPEQASKYRGAQCIVNSDRVFVNARGKDIELTANEAIGLGAKVVVIDGKDYIAFDADKVYLGTKALGESEPVLKGETTVKWLESLCTQLMNLTQAMKTPQGDTKVWASTVTGVAAGLHSVLNTLKSRLPKLESTKVFTE